LELKLDVTMRAADEAAFRRNFDPAYEPPRT